MPAGALQTLSLVDFSGGLNLQAAPSELARNESPDCLNVTLDERGGAVKRLGLEKIADHGTNATPLLLFYSRALDKLFMQLGVNLYKSDDAGVNWSASLHAFSTGARLGICDFLGKVAIIHPADGVWTYDGAAFSGAKLANSPNGNVIAVWQNALWSAGDPAAPSTVTRSDPGALTYPVTPVANALRMKDDSPITAMAPATGLDPVAQGPLLVFKEESCYRIKDSTNGSYTLLDAAYGASGPLCLGTNNGVTVALSRRGIIATDGTVEPKLVSAKLEPFFRSAQLAYSTSADWCVGVHRDRFVFSLARTGSASNNVTLEYHPQIGWFSRHGFGMQAYTSYTKNDRRLLGAKVSATPKAATFNVFKSGADDGAAISSYYQSAWLIPANDMLCRLRRIRVRGRGAFTVELRPDFSEVGYTVSFQAEPGGMLWGAGVWGTGIWGANPVEGYEDFWSLGTARAVSFRFAETSSSSATGGRLLSDGVAPEIGAFACYGLDLDYVQLGNA